MPYGGYNPVGLLAAEIVRDKVKISGKIILKGHFLTSAPSNCSVPSVKNQKMKVLLRMVVDHLIVHSLLSCIVSGASMKCEANYGEQAQSDFLSFVPYSYHQKDSHGWHIPTLRREEVGNHS